MTHLRAFLLFLAGTAELLQLRLHAMQLLLLLRRNITPTLHLIIQLLTSGAEAYGRGGQGQEGQGAGGVG